MSRRLRIVFAGTPEFAVPCLQALIDSAKCDAAVELVAVYTQPDRPAGRGRKLTPSPVKERAVRVGLPVFTPETLRDKAVQAQFATLQPDLFVVVAFGMILPKKILAIPKYGCWNVHASLLPRWRGAAPIQRAIAAGDVETGVCLMQMDAGLDTGPVFLRRHVVIDALETGESLTQKLAVEGAIVLSTGVVYLCAATLPVAQMQVEQGANYAHKLDKHEAALDFTRTAVELERQVRAFLPFPVAQAEIAGETVQVLEAHVLPDAQYPQASSSETPSTETPSSKTISPNDLGKVVGANKHGIDLRCSEGVLRVTQLKRAGGRVIRAADYLNARPELKS